MLPLNRATVGTLLAFIATVTWSGNFIVARGLAGDLSPIEIAFWRWVIAFLCLAPFTLKTIIRCLPMLKGKWLRICLSAIMGITLFNTVIYQAGHTTNATNMSLLASTSPILMAVLARIFQKIELRGIQIIGLGCAFLGVVVLISRGSVDTLLNLHFAEGDLWMLAAVVFFSIYSLQTGLRPKEFPQAAFFALLVGIGLLFLLPLVVWQATTLEGLRMPSLPTFATLMYVGIFASVVAFLCWNMSIERVGVVRAGVIYNSLPFIVTIEAVLLLDERLIMPQIIGGLLILSGILTASLGPRILGAPKARLPKS